MNKDIQQYANIINNLPPEFLNALKKPIVVNGIMDTIKESQNDLTNVQLICNNPEQYLKPVSTQMNVIVPQTLSNSKEPYIMNIKNDLNNYRKLYEKEAKQINTIISNTIEGIKQIYPFTKTLKENLKNYTENYAQSIQNMQIPLLNKKIGLAQINVEKFSPQVQENFIKDRNDISKEIDIFFEDVDKFLKNFSDITICNSKNIETAIEEFLKLPKSVKDLSTLMKNSKLSFERSCRVVFKDLSNKEAIDKAFKSFQQPLNELNELEKKIQTMKVISLKEIEDQKNIIDGSKKDLDEIEKKLKAKSDEITNEIQIIREKYGEKKEDLDEFTPSGLVNIETENFYKEVLSNTQTINEQIKIINQSLNDNMEIIKQNSRLDLLFIMDITNSMDVYLDQVKRQVLDIINEIRKECAGIEIYIGFIGYRDFSDLDFGESYINLELTEKYENIIQNIKYLKAEGGGDIPEDLCGALEFAKEKKWKGKSRFAILVTDSPCHGRKYYDDTTENFDNYPDGDREGRNIEDYIKFLAENEISVFCLKVSPSTDKMFEIFEEVYNRNKRKDCNNQFMADIGENIFNVVTSYAIKTFQNRKVEDIKE